MFRCEHIVGDTANRRNALIKAFVRAGTSMDVQQIADSVESMKIHRRTKTGKSECIVILLYVRCVKQCVGSE